jgi:AcrR family transcriptional regulator
MTQPGLRERKKARTRAAIQEHALRLFREQGYAETTVDQIAAAAEVSPATFFRYFPTKEDTVLYDAIDPLMIEVFRAQPAELSPIQALRATLRNGYAALSPEQLRSETERQRLFDSTPELRARMMEQYYNGIEMLAGLAAERSGRDPGDIAVRAWAGAVIGVVMAASYSHGDGRSIEHSIDAIDEGLAQLEAGFPL